MNDNIVCGGTPQLQDCGHYYSKSVYVLCPQCASLKNLKKLNKAIKQGKKTSNNNFFPGAW